MELATGILFAFGWLGTTTTLEANPNFALARFLVSTQSDYGNTFDPKNGSWRASY